jgi:ADP-ribose 1''-phosphate phosphatase
MIEYRKGSLFDAPEGSLLVHAVNCQGVWGAGISKEFKARFPWAYDQYREDCIKRGILNKGTYSIYYGQSAEHLKDVIYAGYKEYSVGCLFTSSRFGNEKDSVDKILQNTLSSVSYLLLRLSHFSDTSKLEIHSNKFNSGLFGVPWAKTEKIVNTCLEYFPDQKWVVWEI